MTPQLAHEGLGFDDCARESVRDLHKPEPTVFWTDLALTAVTGWGAFWAAVFLPTVWMIPTLVLASLAIYRGLCFIHELTHLRPKALPGFETVWNFFFGVPLLLPSFVYVGVHQDHHKISTYGTAQDPEYMPFAQSNHMMVLFVAHSVLIPVFLFARFVILSPFALIAPPLHRWLAEHASALSMNLAYRRDLSGGLDRSMKVWEGVILGVWLPLLACMVAGILPWRILFLWYATTALICMVNTIRTLGAHQYQSSGAPYDRTGQLLDSIDTPGAIWTELWAPVGLRYHALHHYFPGIPYHNLSKAHRRLVHALPADAPYRRTASSGLWKSLANLYKTGLKSRLNQQ